MEESTQKTTNDIGETFITQENAVIGWTLGKHIVSRRWNYDHFPVCTIELSGKAKENACSVIKSLGLWNI